MQETSVAESQGISQMDEPTSSRRSCWDETISRYLWQGMSPISSHVQVSSQGHQCWWSRHHVTRKKMSPHHEESESRFLEDVKNSSTTSSRLQQNAGVLTGGTRDETFTKVMKMTGADEEDWRGRKTEDEDRRGRQKTQGVEMMARCITCGTTLLLVGASVGVWVLDPQKQNEHFVLSCTNVLIYFISEVYVKM